MRLLFQLLHKVAQRLLGRSETKQERAVRLAAFKRNVRTVNPRAGRYAVDHTAPGRTMQLAMSLSLNREKTQEAVKDIYGFYQMDNSYESVNVFTLLMYSLACQIQLVNKARKQVSVYMRNLIEAAERAWYEFGHVLRNLVRRRELIPRAVANYTIKSIQDQGGMKNT